MIKQGQSCGRAMAERRQSDGTAVSAVAPWQQEGTGFEGGQGISVQSLYVLPVPAWVLSWYFGFLPLDIQMLIGFSKLSVGWNSRQCRTHHTGCSHGTPSDAPDKKRQRDYSYVHTREQSSCMKEKKCQEVVTKKFFFFCRESSWSPKLNLMCGSLSPLWFNPVIAAVPFKWTDFTANFFTI